MSESWISPKIIIGNIAKGNYYYPRPNLVEGIWVEIKKGNNVLIAAPRRVGKSSVMHDMVSNCPDDYKCHFENVQGINTEIEFYKRLYAMIILGLNGFEKTKTWLSKLFKEHKISEISLDGNVKFADGEINYIDEIDRIIPKLKSQQVKLLLLIDELPEVLHKLYKADKKEEAISILKNLRRWRQNSQFDSLRFVLAGSVGLHHVVKSLEGRAVDVNDFNPIQFEALEKEDAENYIHWATANGASIQYSNALKNHLLSKIQYYVPFFINLMLDEIDRKARKESRVSVLPEHIDSAFEAIVKSSDHFKDWKSRLFDYMAADDAGFLNEILTHIAHKNSITRQKQYDIATAHSKTTDYVELLDGLERDGYITELKGKYVFLSPFLKAFWKRNNPIYHG